MESPVKYKVQVKKGEKAFKIPKVVLEELKGIGAPKLLNSMKREFVSCPVFAKDLPFLICFACPNFIRRVTGTVDCAGEQIRYDIVDKV